DRNAKRSDVLSAAAEAGSTDAVIRAYGFMGRGERPPGSAFATRIAMQGMDPSDPRYAGYKRALDEDTAARANVADEAARRTLENYRKEHPFLHASPPQRQAHVAPHQ